MSIKVIRSTRMKRKQALKVMGMVLAGSLVLSEASPVPVRAASAAVQSSQEQDVSDEQETSENAAVCYIDTKTVLRRKMR